MASVGIAPVQGIVDHHVAEDGGEARGAQARSEAAMSPPLPPPLLLLAGVLGLALAFPRMERPTSNPRLIAEVFAIAARTCLGFAAGWALYWLIEQRW